MKKEIQDTDLISARKAAIAFSDDAKKFLKEIFDLREQLKEARRMFPTFIVVGIMIGVLGILITLWYVN